MEGHGAEDEDGEQVLVVLEWKEMAEDDNCDGGDEWPDKGGTYALLVEETRKFEDCDGEKEAYKEHKPDAPENDGCEADG